MIHVLPDDLLGDERLAEIARGCGDPELVALNTTRLDGQRLDLAELATAAGTLPFLAEKRLVVVRRLLAQLEGRPAEGGAGDRRRGARSDQVQALLKCLDDLPSTTELVFVEETTSGRGPVHQAIVRLGGEILDSRPLRPEELREWAERRARAKGGLIQPEAAEALVTATGDDLRRLDGELDKLLTYADGDEVTAADVRLLVGEALDDNVFHLVDAIGLRDRRLALAKLRELLGSGAAVPYLLAMIARQVRLLIQVREALAVTSDSQTIASQIRIAPWQARNLVGQARRFALLDLERAHRRLLDADRAIKTGRLEGDAALDLLVAELAER